LDSAKSIVGVEDEVAVRRVVPKGSQVRKNGSVVASFAIGGVVGAVVVFTCEVAGCDAIVGVVPGQDAVGLVVLVRDCKAGGG
jgi:hypothetical protein